MGHVEAALLITGDAAKGFVILKVSTEAGVQRPYNSTGEAEVLCRWCGFVDRGLNPWRLCVARTCPRSSEADAASSAPDHGLFECSMHPSEEFARIAQICCFAHSTRKAQHRILS